MKDTGEWTEYFKETTKKIANELLIEAKQESKTYGEVTRYIKRLNQQAYGDITDPEDHAGMKLNDAICGLAIRMIHDEERSLPINRGENND